MQIVNRRFLRGLTMICFCDCFIWVSLCISMKLIRAITMWPASLNYGHVPKLLISLFTAMALSDDQVSRQICLSTYAHALRRSYSLLRLNEIGHSLQDVGQETVSNLFGNLIVYACIKTRSIPRAQTSSAPSSRSMKRFSPAWKCLVQMLPTNLCVLSRPAGKLHDNQIIRSRISVMLLAKSP